VDVNHEQIIGVIEERLLLLEKLHLEMTAAIGMLKLALQGISPTEEGNENPDEPNPYL